MLLYFNLLHFKQASTRKDSRGSEVSSAAVSGALHAHKKAATTDGNLKKLIVAGKKNQKN